MKKSQISVETLLMYGLALLVVMLVLGALFVFGVIDTCTLTPRSPRCMPVRNITPPSHNLTAVPLSDIPPIEIEEFEYCLEWNDWIDRNIVYYNCRRLENLTCDIISNNQLLVYERGNVTPVQIYNCTAWTEAFRVIE